MRKGYLSYRWKWRLRWACRYTQSCNGLHCLQTYYGNRVGFRHIKLEIWPNWMAAHAGLKDSQPYNTKVPFHCFFLFSEPGTQLLLCSETFSSPTPPRDDTGWVKPASSIIWSLSESKSDTTLHKVNSCLSELSDNLLIHKNNNGNVIVSAVNVEEQIPKDHLLKTALLGGALSHSDLYASNQRIYSTSQSKCADDSQKSVGNEEETRRRMSGTNGYDRNRMTGSSSAGGDENLSRITDGVTSQGPSQPRTAEGMLVSHLSAGPSGALAVHDPGTRSIVAGTAGAGSLAAGNRGVFRPPQTVAEPVGRYSTVYSSAGGSSTLSPYSQLYSSHGQGTALSLNTFYNSQYSGYTPSTVLQGHLYNPPVESYSAVLQNLGSHAAQSQIQPSPYGRGSSGPSVGQYSYLSSRTNSESPGPSKNFSQSSASSLREREELELKMRREHEMEIQRRHHSTSFLKDEKSHHFSVPYTEMSRASLSSSSLRESPKLKRELPLSAQDIYKVPSGREGSLKHRILRPSDSSSSAAGGVVRHSAFINTEEPSPKRTKPNGVDASRVVINRESNIPGPGPPSDLKFPDPVPSGDVTASGNQSHLQYPQHFMRGSIIQLANGELKRVEDLVTDDFVQSADISSDLKIDSSTVVQIEENPSQGTAVLGFLVGEHKVQVRLTRYKKVYLEKIIWAPSSEFVSSSIPSWQTLTAHAQRFRSARDLAFCLKVPLDSLLVWASSEGSGETAQMRRLAWTFAARIGDKYQICLRRSILSYLKLL